MERKLIWSVLVALMLGGLSAGVSAHETGGADSQEYNAVLYSDIYNNNIAESAQIVDVDEDGKEELFVAGVRTDYSWIPSPNPRCSWCNDWRVHTFAWNGSSLTPELTGTLDYGYDTWVDAAWGNRVVGVGNMYPCGSGEAHAGMAVFDASSLDLEHHDWGNRGLCPGEWTPCHCWMSSFRAVSLTDVDGDSFEEIVAGGSGDDRGLNGYVRDWLLSIRTSDGEEFEEELHAFLDHDDSTSEAIYDLTVDNVDEDNLQEIVAVGFRQLSGKRRTVLRIMTWDGQELDAEYAKTLSIGDNEDHLGHVATGNLDGIASKEDRSWRLVVGWQQIQLARKGGAMGRNDLGRRGREDLGPGVREPYRGHRGLRPGRRWSGRNPSRRERRLRRRSWFERWVRARAPLRRLVLQSTVAPRVFPGRGCHAVEDVVFHQGLRYER